MGSWPPPSAPPERNPRLPPRRAHTLPAKKCVPSRGVFPPDRLFPVDSRGSRNTLSAGGYGRSSHTWHTRLPVYRAGFSVFAPTARRGAPPPFPRPKKDRAKIRPQKAPPPPLERRIYDKRRKRRSFPRPQSPGSPPAEFPTTPVPVPFSRKPEPCPAGYRRAPYPKKTKKECRAPHRLSLPVSLSPRRKAARSAPISARQAFQCAPQRRPFPPVGCPPT